MTYIPCCISRGFSVYSAHMAFWHGSILSARHLWIFSTRAVYELVFNLAVQKCMNVLFFVLDLILNWFLFCFIFPPQIFFCIVCFFKKRNKMYLHFNEKLLYGVLLSKTSSYFELFQVWHCHTLVWMNVICFLSEFWLVRITSVNRKTLF